MSSPTQDAPSGRALMQMAVGFVATTLLKQAWQPPAELVAPLGNRTVYGAFVSLKRRGHLRSCCGFLGQQVPIVQALSVAAARTAVDDHRFPPIAWSELPHLDVEVWLLDAPQAVSAQGAARIESVMIGKHGLQIARGNQSGLLLPGVAVEHGWNAEQFLEQVSIKAGLPPSAWREADTRLATFEGTSVRAPIAEVGVNLAQVTPPPIVTRDVVVPLARHAGQNVLNLLRGAVASPYAPGIADASVCGLVLMLEGQHVGHRMEVSRIDTRPSLPLQSTLFSLSESLAQALAQHPDRERWVEGVRVGLTILHDTAMHGTVGDVDLAGLDTHLRAALVIERNRHALVFDPALDAQALVDDAARVARVQQPTHASVQSLAVVTTEPRVVVRQVPQPVAGPSIRPAAQAGRFYPSDSLELQQMIDTLLSGDAPPPSDWPVAMVPHAGLIYSGRLAAEVLRRVTIPETVIVLGPKHTPHGVEWAVAPHETWSIPGAELKSDPVLARRLVEAIPGLELDAAAHQLEHAIEVELPILARLAPQSRVVGIALGGGDLENCRRFARGLAGVIRAMPQRPLLVISTDMNHFASDAENRRLDALALAALNQLDPEHLFREVTSRQISMCGLIPAVIVMETLRQLGGLTLVEHVGYHTSADVSGDTRRVVGYAGALVR